MKRIPVSQARRVFPDLVHQAYYAGETTIVTRRGKGDVAAIVPIRVLGAAPLPASHKGLHRKKPSDSVPEQPPNRAKLFP